MPKIFISYRSLLVWLCLALLLGGGVAVGLVMLRGERKNENDGGPSMSAAVTNRNGMKLVRIPPGKFKMGSPVGETNRIDDKQHDVEITYEFWLGVHEVTQKEFREVMGYNPSYFSTNARGKQGVDYGNSGTGGLKRPPGRGGDLAVPRVRWMVRPGDGKSKIPAGDDTENYPVENVLWEQAKEFCEKLTAKEKNKLGGWKYRLPSEAEWEYSCRGGPPYGVFHFGNSLSSDKANFNGNYPDGGASKGPYLARTCKVGSYQANSFGLHDMHGNVEEWCADWYDMSY